MIFPYIELDVKSFDLGIEHRDATNDKGKHNECIMYMYTCDCLEKSAICRRKFSIKLLDLHFGYLTTLYRKPMKLCIQSLDFLE